MQGVILVAVNIVPPDSVNAIVFENLSMHGTFRDWANQITDEVNLRSFIVGTGSPEGVVNAKQTKKYMDDTGVPGSIEYIKQVDDVAGDETLGWVLV